MGDLTFLAAGYAVFWIVSFVFIYTLVSRQRNLEKEVQVLEQLVQQESETE
jgi:CcmD family protein